MTSPRSMRKDITGIRAQLYSIPVVNRDPLHKASWLQSPVFQICESACHQQPSTFEVAASTARRILSTVENIVDVHLRVGIPDSTSPKSRRKTTHISARASRETGKTVSILAVSSYDLRIAQLGAPPVQYIMTIKLNWHPLMNGHAHDLEQHIDEHDLAHKITAGAEPGSDNLDTQSIFEVHQALASFAESKAHANLDVMAVEASHVGFEAFERTMQSGHAARIELKFSETYYQPEKPHSRISVAYAFDKHWSDGLQQSQKAAGLKGDNHRALVALGSNLGDRVGMIEQACTEMNLRGLKVLRTSSLYESEPMYKTDQPSFLNGVCQVRHISCYPKAKKFSLIEPAD